MADVQDYTSAQAAMQNYGTQTYSPAAGSHTNEKRKYEAEVANDWAMALYNRDLEQAQWERNMEYNDPSVTYKRLIAAGMNPLAAMESIAGVGSQAPSSLSASGQVHAKTSSADTVAQAQNLATASSAAGIISQGVKNLAEARNVEAHTSTWASEVHTLQDVQRAQAGLARVQSSWYPRIASSSANASDASAKMNEAAALLHEEQSKLVNRQAEYQKRQLSWFFPDKVKEYDQAYADVQQKMAAVKSDLAQAGYFRASSGYMRSASGYMDSASGAQKAYTKLLNDQSFLTKTEQVGQAIKNMYLNTGIPVNVVGGMLINNLNSKSVFDQFGRWKNGLPFDENSFDYKLYHKMVGLDLDNMQSARDIGIETVKQFMWNRYDMIHQNVNGTIKAVSPWAPQ